MIQTSIPKTLNPIIELNWLGWQTNTLRLMQHGWQISVSENVYHNTLDMAIKYPKIGIQGVSMDNSFNYMRMINPINLHIPLRFNIQMAHYIDIVTQVQEYAWKPINAQPQYMNINPKYTKLEDFALFETLPSKEKQIIITEPSFDKVLQMALEHQAPKQKELRQKARSKMGAILRVAA